jgi:hypothetical protein
MAFSVPGVGSVNQQNDELKAILEIQRRVSQDVARAREAGLKSFLGQQELDLRKRQMGLQQELAQSDLALRQAKNKREAEVHEEGQEQREQRRTAFSRLSELQDQVSAASEGPIAGLGGGVLPAEPVDSLLLAARQLSRDPNAGEAGLDIYTKLLSAEKTLAETTGLQAGAEKTRAEISRKYGVGTNPVVEEATRLAMLNISDKTVELSELTREELEERIRAKAAFIDRQGGTLDPDSLSKAIILNKISDEASLQQIEDFFDATKRRPVIKEGEARARATGKDAAVESSISGKIDVEAENLGNLLFRTAFGDRFSDALSDNRYDDITKSIIAGASELESQGEVDSQAAIANFKSQKIKEITRHIRQNLELKNGKVKVRSEVRPVTPPIGPGQPLGTTSEPSMSSGEFKSLLRLLEVLGIEPKKLLEEK